MAFFTAIEKNLRGHCKAIICTIECDVGGEEEEEKVEESTMLEEEMKAQANSSTQGMQSSLNPPLFDFVLQLILFKTLQFCIIGHFP